MKKTVLSLLLACAINTLAANAECTNFCPDKLTVSADFLWMKAVPEEYNAALIQVNGSNLVTTTTLYPYQFGWDAGFRIGLGYDICCNNINGHSFASWKYYRSVQNTSIIGQDTALITNSVKVVNSSTFNDFTGSGTALISYNGSGDFLYNRLDLGFLSGGFCCGSLTLSPYTTFTYLHLRNALTEFVTVPNAGGSFNNRSSLSGYGLSLGLESFFDFASCFSLQTKTAVTGMWGNYDYSYRSFFNAMGTTGLLNTSFWKGSWIFDLGLALEYQINLCNCYPLNMRLGWEFEYLPNAILLNNTVSGEVQSLDVTTNSLVLGVDVGF